MTEEIREVAEARADVWFNMRHRGMCGYRLGKDDEEITEAECSCGRADMLADLVEAVRKDERERLLGIAELLVEAGALDDDGPLGRAYLMLDIAMLTIPPEGGTEG